MTIGNIIERAFALARSGEYANVVDVGKVLKKEGFSQVDEHLSSPSIRRELRDLCNAANRDRNDQANS